jgi:predicted branched-subunit amino acid permease
MINPDIAFNLRFTFYSPSLDNRVLAKLSCTKKFKWYHELLDTRSFKIGASELALVFKVGASELAPTL